MDHWVVMPTNLYGPQDNFHPDYNYVVVALISFFQEAVRDEVVSWSSGASRREFLHIDATAAASLFLLGLWKDIYDNNTKPMLRHIYVGTSTGISILKLAQLIAKITGYSGKISSDPNKPDGTMRKLMPFIFL